MCRSSCRKDTAEDDALVRISQHGSRRASMAEPPPASQEEDEEEIMAPATPGREERLRLLETSRAWLSKLLINAGVHVVPSDIERRCLAFIEMEQSFYAASFRTGPRQNDDMMDSWLWSLRRIYVPLLYHHRRRCHHTLLRRATQCFFRRRVSILLCSAVSRLHFCVEDFRRYKRLLPLCSDVVGLPHQAAEVGYHPLVGIDRPVKKLLRWVMPREDTDKGLRVMSIVGPAGMGKTTLAMELRNRLRHQTGQYFQCNVMARASRRTDDRSELLLQDILSQISDMAEPASSSDDSRPNTVRLLVERISECLQDKRYFIVIDDIWKPSDWWEIKGAFPNNNLDSRILITTRIRAIERSYDSNVLVHQMKTLNEFDSTRLLLTRAVGSVDGCLPHNAKICSDEILRRCEGVPLFITGMTDWFKQQLQLQKEEEHRQRFPFYSEEQVPQLPKRFEQALFHSYNDIDDELRLLSMYMSMFPYGYKFEKDRLITKWFCDCLAHWRCTHVNYAEEDADYSFSELVDKSVITCVSANCKESLDEAEACQWHVNQFMMQFMAFKSAEMGYVFTSATLNLAADQTKTKVPRRLALHHPDPKVPSLLQAMDLSQTRSLAVSGAVDHIPLEKFANLVTLDLEGWENMKDDDLLQICRSKMLFLTYLSVRSTRVSRLPQEIKELGCLEILDVSHTKISKLPTEVFELPNLDKLDLGGTHIRQLQKQIVGLRHTLRALLLPGEGMINSIEIATRVPDDIRDCYKLERLATVDLSEHPASFVGALGDLEDLKVLAIKWSFHQSTDKAYCKALLSAIKRWSHLKSLTIHCGLGCSMEFLSFLSDPPKELEKFKVIAGRFTVVPQWINQCNLSFLQITVCRLGMDDLKILSNLPLRCLILGMEFTPSEAIVIPSEGFPMLQRFSIEFPVPWLTFTTGAMKNLTYLRLKFCSGPANKGSVPSGIINLQSVTDVVLSYSKWCADSSSVKTTVEAVKKEVAKHCNPIDLFINGAIVDVQVDGMEEAHEIHSEITGDAIDGVQQDGEETMTVTPKVQASGEETVQRTIEIQSEIEIEDDTETNP